MDLTVRNVEQINGRLHFDLFVANLDKVETKDDGTVDTIEGAFPVVPIRVANLLRQIFMAQIPSWCIDTVEIITNTTHLIDELMALRLGLIPLVIAEEPTEEAASEFRRGLETTELSLNVRARPTAAVTQVYTDAVISSNPNVKMVPGIILISLGKDHQLSFKAQIKQGIGSQHSKYDVVSISAFTQVEDHFHFQVGINGLMPPGDVLRVALERIHAILPIGTITVE